MWKEFELCPLSNEKHSFFYDIENGKFKCDVCTSGKEITRFDVEVKIVVNYLKFQKENPFVYDLKTFQDGRFTLAMPDLSHIMNCVASIKQFGKDKDGNDKKNRWHNIGKAFIYKDGTGTIQLDSIPLNWDGRFKLYHVEENRRQQEEPKSESGQTEGFGGE